MMISLHFWLRLLICCLGLWGCGWLTSVAWRRKKENGTITPIITPKMQVKEKLRTAVTNTAKIGVGVVLGTLLGMEIRDRQLIDNTHTYLDVLVLEQYTADKYLLQPARMQPWISKTCIPIDLTPGRKMKFYTYEQAVNCQRVKAFEFYADEKGERLNASN